MTTAMTTDTDTPAVIDAPDTPADYSDLPLVRADLPVRFRDFQNRIADLIAQIPALEIQSGDTDAEIARKAKTARTVRLEIRSVRLDGVALHSQAKKPVLDAGKRLDALRTALVTACSRHEEKLTEIEQHQERMEEEARKAQAEIRRAKLAEYGYTPNAALYGVTGEALGIMSDAAFDALLADAKALHEAREMKQQAEKAERQRAAEEQKAIAEQRAELERQRAELERQREELEGQRRLAAANLYRTRLAQHTTTCPDCTPVGPECADWPDAEWNSYLAVATATQADINRTREAQRIAEEEETKRQEALRAEAEKQRVAAQEQLTRAALKRKQAAIAEQSPDAELILAFLNAAPPSLTTVPANQAFRALWTKFSEEATAIARDLYAGNF